MEPTLRILFIGNSFTMLLFFAVMRPQDSPHSLSSMFFSFYWTGSIIFGGGQVMLPMLLVWWL